MDTEAMRLKSSDDTGVGAGRSNGDAYVPRISFPLVFTCLASAVMLTLSTKRQLRNENEPM